MRSYAKQFLSVAAIVLVAGAVQSGDLQGSASQIGDFLRNIDGTVKGYISQDQANYLCKAEGKRLPTARELATEGVRHGAEMFELNHFSPENKPQTFQLIKVINVDDGSKDQFYYSYEKYVRPAGDSGLYYAWSSSIHAGNTNFGRGLYGYDGSAGLVYSDSAGSHHTARCMSDF